LLIHLEQVFTKPAREALAEDFRISMLLHSLGNKVLESLILNEEAAAQSTMFNTIIMHQPDVDAAGVMQWINKVSPQEELYITVNQHDGVLIISDIVNRIRLGLFPGDLIAHSLPKLSVIDFTHAHNVARAHWLFTDFENNIVRLICKRMIHGNASDQRINMGLESQLIYFADKFSYSFPEPELMRLRT
jgi:esterase/lipase superfamily enzyme